MDDLIKSLQPVLTKVDKRYFNQIKIDKTRYDLHSQLQTELDVQIKENEQLAQDKEAIQQHQEFYNIFANKLVIFDPLDRPIPKEEENQALKQSELLTALD